MKYKKQSYLKSSVAFVAELSAGGALLDTNEDEDELG